MIMSPPERGKHLSKGVDLRLAHLGTIAAILSSLPLTIQPLTWSSAKLSYRRRSQIGCARRGILPVLRLRLKMLRTLGYRFKRAFASCTRSRLLALTSAACSALALARHCRNTETVLVEVARRAAQFPWNTCHHWGSPRQQIHSRERRHLGGEVRTLDVRRHPLRQSGITTTLGPIIGM
jgi:hypothetical protein